MDNTLTLEDTEYEPEVVPALCNILTNMRAAEAARVALDAAKASLTAFNNSVVEVYFGELSEEIRPLDLQSFFWNNEPDTPCRECGEPFVDMASHPSELIHYVLNCCRVMGTRT